jgi:mono/diheme cytochrome c family protein
MKKFKKIALVFLSLIVVLGVSGYVYFNQQFPKEIKAEDIKIAITPERLERGKYIFHHAAACVDCHSTRDFSKLSGPVKPGTEGMGGDKFDEEMGLPGTFYARNITPYGVGTWTDGELLRAITEGISKDGSALFPIMPYLVYGKMDREDIYSVIAYIRTLPSIKNDVPKDAVKFPMNMIMKTIPTKNSFTTKPDKKDIIAYGKYLVEGASCTDCHTPSKDGEPIPGKMFSGGIEINLPGNTVVRTANITPDNETGLGQWTKEQFIKRFKQCSDPAYGNTPYKPGEFQTIMPWTVYAGLTEEDLGAIYEYLRTIPAVKNQVEKFGVKQQY